MKNIFMTLAVVAAMFAAASCACNNNGQKAAEGADCTECADCGGCDKAAKTCETSCDADCDKDCDKACEKECHKDKACKQCDSTCVDCKKAE